MFQLGLCIKVCLVKVGKDGNIPSCKEGRVLLALLNDGPILSRSGQGINKKIRKKNEVVKPSG